MALVLEPIVDGPDGGETIVFVQGWPDDASLWDEAVVALSPKYRCVRVNMPNYGGTITSRWGVTTDEVVDALVDLFRRFGSEERPATLVLHDWGSYWGHAAHHRCPEVVGRVVSLDVAPHFTPTPGAVLGIVAYQGWLWAAFVIGGAIGNTMTRLMAKGAGAPAPRERIDARMNYPYRNVWADLVSGRTRAMTRGYWPKCPLLFMYGARKPFMFHSERWLAHVRAVGGVVIEVPSSHWVTRHPSFVPTLVAWLEANPSSR